VVIAGGIEGDAIIDLCLLDMGRDGGWPFIFYILRDLFDRRRAFFFLVVRFICILQRMRERQRWSIEDIISLVRYLGGTVRKCWDYFSSDVPFLTEM
jgi:hypothetical protein